MTVFEDNTAVTLSDLNNIAVDLGDTTFSAFSDEKFGVDKLNEITADIVGKGVLKIGNKCEVVLSDSGVYVQSGVIVFESGAKIRIESPVEIAATAGDYIYAFNDVTTGKASIQASSTKPTSGDYVMLAQLISEGVVDLREMSVAKLTLSAELQNNYAEQTAEILATAGRAEVVIQPKLAQCKYLIAKETTLAAVADEDDNFFTIELTEDYQTAYYGEGGAGSHGRIEVKKVDGLLYFRGWVSNSYYDPEESITFILA